jgi:fucose 4-O-acetylase-like acetyltransferase
VFIVSKNIGQQPRLLWVDVLKFFGILAIVWGHTLSSGAVRQYLYSFHVPLFFFAIGLYFKPSKTPFGCFCKEKAISLLFPYFAFAVISVLIFAVLGGLASSALVLTYLIFHCVQIFLKC